MYDSSKEVAGLRRVDVAGSYIGMFLFSSYRPFSLLLLLLTTTITTTTTNNKNNSLCDCSSSV